MNSKLEKSARKLQQANRAGKEADHDSSAKAQSEMNSPNQAKGRPDTGHPSNAGRDGGA